MGATAPDAESRFDHLFRAHARPVLAYCLRRTGHADAHDAAAEVFAIAWRRIDDVPQGTAALPWLYGVSRRVLANQRRSTSRHRRVTDKVRNRRPAQPPLPDIVAVRRSEDQLVADAVDALPEPDRDVLILVAWEGLTREQAAQVLGCSTEAAKKRFQRALDRLRKDLAPVLDADTTDRDEPTEPRRAHEGGG